MSLLRVLQIADLSAIQVIEQQNDFPWTEGMLRDCFLAHYEVYGIEQDKKIIAFAMMRVMQDEAEILNIATHNDFRRQGYGKLLLQHLLDIAKQKSVKAVYLEVRTSNNAAMSLYKKLGFKRMGVREKYYPAAHGREDAIIWCFSF